MLQYCSFTAVQWKCLGFAALDCFLHFSCWIIFHVSSVREQGGFSGGVLLGSALRGRRWSPVLQTACWRADSPFTLEFLEMG